MTRAPAVRVIGRAVVTLALLAACGSDVPSRAQTRRVADLPARFDIGSVASAAQIAAVDIDVNAAGAGLPAGRGSVAQGAVLYAAQCAVCHGSDGEGRGMFPRLIGREPGDNFVFGRNAKLTKTVGNYWPYSTTLFDYIRRAMPLTAPGSLQPDQVYALVAFLLARNDIVADSAVLDARTLPGIKMPARDHFVRDNREGGRQFR
ncbi:MAG TPA: c-type cytochrome [Longimicrobiales bacterium]